MVSILHPAGGMGSKDFRETFLYAAEQLGKVRLLLRG